MPNSPLDEIEVYGQFRESPPNSEEFLTLNFSLGSAARERRWRNYGLSADFLGDYFAAFFPGDQIPDSKINKKDTVKAAVSYIANELIENAVKYSSIPAKLPVTITLYLFEHELMFLSVNYADRAAADRLRRFVQELEINDPLELYHRQLERTAKGSEGSHMGILTIVNDYLAEMGWRFQPVAQDATLVQVSVMAHLAIEHL